MAAATTDKKILDLIEKTGAYLDIMLYTAPYNHDGLMYYHEIMQTLKDYHDLKWSVGAMMVRIRDEIILPVQHNAPVLIATKGQPIYDVLSKHLEQL